VRKIVEEALEAEVADAVGRGYYENGAPPGAGYRNGYRRGRLATAEGAIEYGVPQVADRPEPFVSRVRAGLAGRTAELERLAVEMYARGLSTRDVEAAFRDATGASLLSRTAVSQVTERLWQEYEGFATRDLSEFAVAYFFVDGVAERLHAGLPREAVLCAWGITEDGRKVLLHLAPGTKEDTASCTAFFEDLKRRGLPDPLLAVTDGAPGLIRAAETCFPRALRQRCLAHRLRNLRSKAPESQWPEIAIRARACYEAASPALATLLREDFAQVYGRELPAVVQCFTDDFEACIAHLRFPLRHRKVIRTTNLLERLFLEERRRTKIIPHAFGERPVLKLMYAAMIRAADRWRGIAVGEFEQRQLRAIRDELDRAHVERVRPVARPSASASPVRLSSKNRT
jgi:transposase-like protein